MKKQIVSIIIVFAVALLAPQITQAQGTTTFLSNLGQTSTGSAYVGSDSWLAAGFYTGNNAGGYVLNSVQLEMLNATGNPTGFTVMIYTATGAESPAGLPVSSLGTLTGSSDPATSGNYTYTAPSSLSLSSESLYFIVVTAGTTVANGAYEWSYTSTTTDQSMNGWIASITFSSSTGSSSWVGLGGNPNYNFSQFALLATPVPEPGILGLFALGGLLVGFQRWKAK